jgi:O-antigen ligase
MRALSLPRWRIEGGTSLAVAVVAVVVMAPLVAWTISEEAWRLLVLVALAALSPIALRWPISVAFGAYAFVLPFDTVSVIANTGGATASRLVGILAAAVLLAVGVVEGRLARPPRVALWVALLFGWGLLTMAWAVSADEAQKKLMSHISLVAMYFVAVSFRVTGKELRTVCVLTMLGGALAAVAGVISGFEADAPRATRATLSLGGIEANPNGVAQSLMLPVAMATGLFLAARTAMVRIVAAVGISAIAAAIFLTMSRASLLALAIMMCVFLYRFRVRWQIIAVAGLLVILLPFMPELFFDRIFRVFSGEDSTGAGRTEIWSVGLRALEEYIWFGAGRANFRTVYEDQVVGSAKASHSTFLGTWVELGLVGLVFLVLIFIIHLRMAKGLYRRPLSETAFFVAIEAASVGFLVIAFFGDILWRKQVWMPWILMVWASRLREEPPAT